MRFVRAGLFSTSLLTVASATFIVLGTPASVVANPSDLQQSGVGDSVCVETINGSPFVGGQSSIRQCASTPGSPTTPPPPEAPKPPPSGWALAWSDEFDGTGVDRSKWNVLNNSTYGDGNSELACLTDRVENVRVSAGTLTISAQRESGLKCGSKDARFPNGRSFSSGHLETKGKASFEYGRFEVRAKTPIAHGRSKGMWPAFWLRPKVGGIGELDVFESMGSSSGEKNSSNRTEQTIHYDYVRTHPKQGKNYTLATGSFADGFHDYAVEWEPGAIRWYIDGTLTFERTKATTPWIDEAFSGEFYLRLNMAVGGPVGTPDAATAFPADFVVDYVRVFRRS